MRVSDQELVVEGSLRSDTSLYDLRAVTPEPRYLLEDPEKEEWVNGIYRATRNLERVLADSNSYAGYAESHASNQSTAQAMCRQSRHMA